MEKNTFLVEMIKQAFEDISDLEECAPGVFYVAAGYHKDGYAHEYYVAAEETTTLSEQAKRYGKPLPGYPRLLSYSLEVPTSGHMAVKYEILKYLTNNDLPLPETETLQSIAVYGMETTPGYFGEFPAPRDTPRGIMLRHQRIMNGVYVVETERLERLIAICYPMWKSDLTPYCVAAGEKAEFDIEHDIENTYGYMFFTEQTACLALFELMLVHEELKDSDLIDRSAMMNAIWETFPEYAATYNQNEQLGLNDGLAQLLSAFGCDIEPVASVENMIGISPDKGTKYLKF